MMRKRVLLIDDSLTIHKIVELTIDRQAFELLSAYDIKEGVRLAAEDVDVILVDNKLCREEGVCISQLTAAAPNASLIMLVGAYDQFLETDASRLNVQDYIIKPFNAATLNQAMHSAAGSPPPEGDAHEIFSEYSAAEIDIKPGTTGENSPEELFSLPDHPLGLDAQPTMEEKLPTVLPDPETEAIPIPPQGKDASLYETGAPIPMGDHNHTDIPAQDTSAESALLFGLFPESSEDGEDKTEKITDSGTLSEEKTEEYPLPEIPEPFHYTPELPMVPTAPESLPAVEKPTDITETEETQADAIAENTKEENPPESAGDTGQTEEKASGDAEEPLPANNLSEYAEDESRSGLERPDEDQSEKNAELDLDEEGHRNLLDSLYNLLTETDKAEQSINLEETTNLFRQEIEERHELMGMFDSFNAALENVAAQLEDIDAAVESHTHRLPGAESSAAFRRIAELNGSGAEEQTSLGKFTIEISKQEFVELLKKYLDKHTLEEIVGDAIHKAVKSVMPNIVEKVVREELKNIKGEK